MPINFTPNYSITPKIAQCLMRIEATKEKVSHSSLTPAILAPLRETTHLYSTHYSTKIEGNKLNPDQIEDVLKHQKHFPGYERDEHEVKGYYAALKVIEEWVTKKIKVTEEQIQILHALAMSHTDSTEKKTPYRDGQNVIRDSKSNQIIYLPPEAKDVPVLMQQMVQWINNTDAPCPIIASIAHYQLATILPYYNGNGHIARLLTTLILHLGGYDLKGLYSLEEYYAHNLKAYYEAINVGPSHNYYSGRAQANITRWIEYFIEGMAIACEKVITDLPHEEKQEEQDYNSIMRPLDIKQRKALSLFQTFETVTASQIGALFNAPPRTSSQLCKNWVEKGFLEIVDASNKGRKYKLAKSYVSLLSK